MLFDRIESGLWNGKDSAWAGLEMKSGGMWSRLRKLLPNWHLLMGCPHLFIRGRRMVGNNLRTKNRKPESMMDASCRLRNRVWKPGRMGMRRKEVVDCIEMFYNLKRRHSYLGCISPRDFEKRRVLQIAA